MPAIGIEKVGLSTIFSHVLGWMAAPNSGGRTKMGERREHRYVAWWNRICNWLTHNEGQCDMSVNDSQVLISKSEGTRGFHFRWWLDGIPARYRFDFHFFFHGSRERGQILNFTCWILFNYCNYNFEWIPRGYWVYE